VEHGIGIRDRFLGACIVVEAADHLTIAEMGQAAWPQVETHNRTALSKEPPHDLGADPAGTAGDGDVAGRHATTLCVCASKR
jgi:hypothetical protein